MDHMIYDGQDKKKKKYIGADLLILSSLDGQRMHQIDHWLRLYDTSGLYTTS